MIKRNKNIKLKKKGNQPATYCPVKGRLMSLFSTGWLFLEVKNLNKNLTCIIKVLRFTSSSLFFFFEFSKGKVSIKISRYTQTHKKRVSKFIVGGGMKNLAIGIDVSKGKLDLCLPRLYRNGLLKTARRPFEVPFW
jgi:hypothetical protein